MIVLPMIYTLQARNIWRFSGKVAVGILCGVLVLVAWLYLSHKTHDWGVYEVESGSMQPAIPTGSLIITHRETPNHYYIGDVITFIGPLRERTIITHRITDQYIDSGIRILTTKGDANTNGDPWTISAGAIMGKVVVRIPYVGYLLHLGKTYVGFLSLAIVFFLVVVLAEIRYLLNV